MPYLKTNKRLTQRGEYVEIYNTDHAPVMLVINPRGERHSARVEDLQEEPIVDNEQQEAKQPKQIERKKPLTQAEKLQLEYLKSIGK